MSVVTLTVVSFDCFATLGWRSPLGWQLLIAGRAQRSDTLACEVFNRDGAGVKTHRRQRAEINHQRFRRFRCFERRR